MRLSSSSEEIATASTSRSVKSAKFFRLAALSQFRIILIGGRRWKVKSFGVPLANISALAIWNRCSWYPFEFLLLDPLARSSHGQGQIPFE